MVERQIAGRGIKNSRLLAAMREVPREAFVPEPLAGHAYEDSPLPIEAEQTISQPYIVALMIEAADVGPGDKVLEIGAGSGYAAAVIGRIADQVIAIERHAELAALAVERMARLGYDNVRIVHGDGSGGMPEQAPFDAILAAASGSARSRGAEAAARGRRHARHADRRTGRGAEPGQGHPRRRGQLPERRSGPRPLRAVDRGTGLARANCMSGCAP